MTISVQPATPAIPPTASMLGVPPILQTQLDFLKLEFQTIQETVARIDGITQKFKNWTIVTWTGGISLILGQKMGAPYVMVAAVPAVLFWFLDAWWRSIQRSFIYRQGLIADFLNGEGIERSFATGRVVDFRIIDPRGRGERDATSVAKQHRYTEFTGMAATLRFRSVAAFYFGIIVLTAAFAVVRAIVAP